MSDRPDFTANTALNAVADTLDNLPVSINAQTLGSLAVDIAAQSAGDIDINLNTASDTVTVALGSSTVTLDVNISGSNATVDTNISGSNTTLDTAITGSSTTLNTDITGSSTTLDTDITAQSVGSIDTVIDGQTGDVGISFNSQTGNVDINFQDQTGGVESGTEFAAAQQNTVSGSGGVFASPGNVDTDTVFTNTTGNPVVAEFISGAQSSGFTDAVRLSFELFNATGGLITELEANPVNLPLSLDPGILIPDNGSVDVRLGNNANSTVVYGVDFVGREVV